MGSDSSKIDLRGNGQTRRYYSSISQSSGCSIMPYKFDYGKWIDLADNREYVIIGGKTYRLTKGNTNIREYVSGNGIIPHKGIKVTERYLIGNGPAGISVISIASNDRNIRLVFIGYRGDEYRLPDQSTWDSGW